MEDSPPDSIQNYELYHFPEIPKLFIDLDLTPRQIDCLAFENKGKSAKEAGDVLSVDGKTYSNTLTNIRDKIRDHYKDIPAFIEAAEANNFLTKRFNNFQYIRKLGDILHKFKSKNTLNKTIDIYYKNDIPLHYVNDLQEHLKSAGFKIGEICAANDKIIMDKNSVSVYIYTQGRYKPSTENLDYDHVIDTHVLGYVTSLFNFLKEYCDSKQVEEERIKHRLYIYDGVNYEYFPQDIIKLLDDMKSGKYGAPEGDWYNALIFKIREVNNKMKAKHKLLPMVVYSSICMMLGTALALYPKPEDNIVLEQNLKIAEDILLNRDELLNKVASELSLKEPKIVALIGAGGSGKTTIARLHLRKCQKNKNKLAFELNAETEENLYNSLGNILYHLLNSSKDKEEWDLVQKAKNQKDKNQRLIKFIRRKLSESDKWLVVFDNAEDLNNITEIIPSDSNLYKKGKVLVTTRNQNIKSVKTLKSSELRCIDVGELADAEKYKLFMLVLEKSTTRKYDATEVKNFLQNIPNYPLDVVSVACYLASSSISLQEYESKMKNIGECFNEVRKGLMSEVTSYGKTRYGIVSVTLEKILQDLKNREVYKNLLLLISMCDSQNIPIKLLEKCSSEDETNLLLRELKKHSFIEFKKDSLSIHRSIQELWFLILKNKIDEKSFEQFMDIFFEKAVNTKEAHNMYYMVNFPKRDRKWLATIYYHVACIVNKMEHLDISQNKRNEYIARLSSIAGIIYEQQIGNMNKAILLYKKVGDKYHCLPEYEQAVSLGEIGRAISYIDLDQGYRFIQEGLTIANKFTEAAPLKAMLLLRLGDIQIRQGNFEKGIETLKKSLSSIPMIGEIWSDKLYIQVNSTLSLVTLFRYFNNKELVKNHSIQEIMKMLKMIKGDRVFYNDKNPVAVSGLVTQLKRDLAVAYNAVEEYSRIESLYKDVKFIYERFCTPAYMYLYISMEYGLSLLRLKKLKEAEDILTQTLSNMEKNNIAIVVRLSSIASLSETKTRLEKYKESLDIALKVINLSKEFKDNKSKSNYSHCLYNAAFASYRLNKLDDAKKYFDMFMKNIHELCETLISDTDRKTLETEGAFSEQSKIENYLLNAYKIYATIFGKDHAFVKDYIGKNVSER